MTDAEILHMVERTFLKTTEILSLMKTGEFITAYEKLGGVQKVVGALGAALQARAKQNNEQKS